MIDLANLASCSDLTTEHAKQAASSAGEIRTLLKRVSEIAKPGEGCPKVLMAIARLVGQPWVEGDLRVELFGDETSTTLIVSCDYGVGIRERLIPLAKFEVPIDEFERALELAPKLVLPLRITDEDGKMVLTPLTVPEARVKTVPPPEIAVDGASLGDTERATAPPPADELQVVDEATPEELAGLVSSAETMPPVLGAEHEVGDGEWPEDEDEAAAFAESAESEQAAESPEADARHRESGRVPTGPQSDGPLPGERISNVHTRPTVRRMVAVDAAAIAALKRHDPRREED